MIMTNSTGLLIYMKFHLLAFLLSVITLILSSEQHAFSRTPGETLRNQSKTIISIMKKEKKMEYARKITGLIESIDAIYGNAYARLQKGEKLVVFLDPAHGKMSNGEWQGGLASLRQSCRELPEEYYSIPLSRKLYRILSANPFIEVKSTDDYMELLEGNSDEYRNIPFSTTVELANKAGAFIILSQHLNNVSMIHKAGGTSNIPGIHVVKSRWGKTMLSYVRDVYTGFLTLYNKLDASGFSRQYAVNLRSLHIEDNMKANNWQRGAVADDRFSYFAEFPVSIIYESGFISHPGEEEKLRDSIHQDTIVQNQYLALLKTVKEVFGIDISGAEALLVNNSGPSSTELLKLSRIALYYIKNGESERAFSVINKMSHIYGKSRFSKDISYYKQIKTTIQRADREYSTALKYTKKKWHKTAARHYRKALNIVGNAPVYSFYRDKFKSSLSPVRKTAARQRETVTEKQSRSTPLIAQKASLNRKIILAVGTGMSLEKALTNALAPDAETLKKLLKSFQNAKKVSWVKKKAKKKTSWVKVVRNINFKEGIYIVSLDKKLNIVKADRVNSVSLDADKYQNQQYLKNSYFARREKQRAL